MKHWNKKKKIVRESLYQSHHVHHVFLQLKEVKFLLASLESVLSELKEHTEEYSVKYDEANLGTIMLSYFSQISEALSGSDGCMSQFNKVVTLLREAIYAICQFKQSVVLWLSFTLNIDGHHLSQDTQKTRSDRKKHFWQYVFEATMTFSSYKCCIHKTPCRADSIKQGNNN